MTLNYVHVLQCINISVLISRCPKDETTSIIQSTKQGVSRFTLEGFKFIAEHPFAFIHCHIRICDAENSKSRCKEGCISLNGLRKRRDVNTDDKLYPLAQGPLTIDDDTKEINANHKTVQGREELRCKFFYYMWLRTCFGPAIQYIEVIQRKVV